MHNMAYTHLFFDLDHTLWDFDRNSNDTLRELYTDFQFSERFGFTESEWLNTFLKVNHELWSLYNVGKIQRDEIRERRFDMVLDALSAPTTERPADLSEIYLMRCPQKPHTMPHTHATLDYLRDKNYQLHIITNGFDDVQAIKMKAANLEGYFDVIVTSETSGHKKPSPEIFHFAAQQAKAKLADSLMIGDNLETDIGGAKAVAMDQVFYNPHKNSHTERPTYEIACLSELQSLL